MINTGPARAEIRARINPLDSIQQLYDRHAALFGLDGGEVKRFVLDGLTKQVKEPEKLQNALQAVRTHPQQVDLRYALALLLEQYGYYEDALQERLEIAHLQPSSHENNIAIGRIYERLDGYDIEDYYRQLFVGGIDNRGFLLAVTRYMATSNKNRLNKITLPNVKHRIEEALILRPDDVTLNLARGLASVAEGDVVSAQSFFLRATFLAELSAPARSVGLDDRTGANSTNTFDAWSLQYAQAFLINPAPQELSTIVVFPPIDPCQFALVRGRLALSRGLVFSALEQFWSAVSRMSKGRTASVQIVFDGFRIFLHEGRFYAVPLAVQNFKIINGVVVHVPGSIEHHKAHVSDLISLRQRNIIRPIWHIWRYRIRPILARTPLVSSIGRGILMLARRTYIKLQAADGVLVETDVVALRERIRTIQAEIRKDAAAPTEARRQKAA